MDKVNFSYSTKNIAVSSQSFFQQRLIEKTELFLKRLRWRAFFYLNPNAQANNNENYGFKSRLSPPTVNELAEFESKLLHLIKNIKFKVSRNPFQHKLLSDIKTITNEDKLIIAADKTTNFYKLSKADYDELLQKNICKTYKKANNNTATNINVEAKHIASKLGIGDRVESMANKEAYVTLKDHKPNFTNNPTCRLINPAKSELGHVSKSLLSKIIKAIVDKNHTNLWRNTRSVLEWFNNTTNKTDSSFICFDVVEFYPSITEKTLREALKFASKITPVSSEDIDIILHAKKSLLFHKASPWTKKNIRQQL